MTNDNVLNIARLVEAFEDHAPSIAQLLTLARETEKRYIAALRDAIDRADLAGVASAAHSIKGSASNIGANKVSSVAASIEDCARKSTWDGIAGYADDLDGVYAEMSQRITEYAAKIA